MNSKTSEPEMFDVPRDVVIATQSVTKIYKEGSLEVFALQDVSLSIREGTTLAAVGPSGSGKSTLLYILGGMVRPTSGLIYWSNCGYDITKLDLEQICKIRRRFIGFVFQEGNLLPNLNILQNIELGGRITGMPDTKGKAQNLLERVGLGHRANSYPMQLSSGERQRVAIAAALIADPKLILADEPTGNLDQAATEEILRLFSALQEETRAAFLIVTHSQKVAAIANRILEIRDGVLIGTHEAGSDIKDLESSRILHLDSVGRLYLPSHLLNQLGSPRTFTTRLEGEKILLIPHVDSRKDGEMEPGKLSALVCKNCGWIVRERGNKCARCGTVL